MSSACCVCVVASVVFIAYDSTKTNLVSKLIDSTKTTTTYTEAKTWPEVVGMDIDAAAAYIESRPGGWYVEKFPDTHRAFRMDLRPERVRVIYNQKTRRVTNLPRSG